MARSPIGDLELAVILSVARLADDAYGASVRRDVSERLAYDYSIGAIYATLQRLQDKKLVTSWMSDPTPVRGGRSKRCFRVTVAGEEVLRHAREVNDAVWRGVPAQWKPA